MTARLSGWYLSPSCFRISAKKRQRIASSSWQGISSNCLASLCCTLHSLKILSQVFYSLRCFGFGLCFDKVSKLLFWQRGKSHLRYYCLKVYEKWKKLANLHWIPPLSTNNATRRPVCRADAIYSYALCWLAGFSHYCFFLDLIGSDKLSYFS